MAAKAQRTSHNVTAPKISLSLSCPLHVSTQNNTSATLWDLRPVRVPRRLGNMLREAWVLNLISAIYWGGGGDALRYTLTAAKCTAPAIIGSCDTHRNKWIAVLTHKTQGVLCIFNPSITL